MCVGQPRGGQGSSRAACPACAHVWRNRPLAKHGGSALVIRAWAPGSTRGVRGLGTDWTLTKRGMRAPDLRGPSFPQEQEQMVAAYVNRCRSIVLEQIVYKCKRVAGYAHELQVQENCEGVCPRPVYRRHLLNRHTLSLCIEGHATACGCLKVEYGSVADRTFMKSESPSTRTHAHRGSSSFRCIHHHTGLSRATQADIDTDHGESRRDN